MARTKSTQRTANRRGKDIEEAIRKELEAEYESKLEEERKRIWDDYQTLIKTTTEHFDQAAKLRDDAIRRELELETNRLLKEKEGELRRNLKAEYDRIVEELKSKFAVEIREAVRKREEELRAEYDTEIRDILRKKDFKELKKMLDKKHE